jgi:phosphatidylglycerophosphate synthase
MAATELRLGDWVSLTRIPLALAFVVLFRAHPGSALAASVVIAVVAQLTDHLDGYLIRKYSEPKVSGWLFDSVSDRAFYIAAAFAFEREYHLSELVLWVFVMREIALYATRIVSGDFESIRPGFRRLVLIHAGIARLAITIGCAIPYFPKGSFAAANSAGILNGIFFATAVFGYYCLSELVRHRTKSRTQ